MLKLECIRNMILGLKTETKAENVHYAPRACSSTIKNVYGNYFQHNVLYKYSTYFGSFKVTLIDFASFNDL